MPPLPPVAGVIRSSFKQSIGSDTDILNRCFWAYTGSTSQVSMGSMATELAAAWHTHMHPIQWNGTALESVECVDLASDSAPLAFAEPGTDGSAAGPPAPAGAAAVLQFEINRRYRGGKPKMFIAGLVAANLLSGQQLEAAYIADLAEAWLAVVAATLVTFSGITVVTEQVNVSYYEGFTNGTGPTGRARVIPTLRETPITDPVVGIAVGSNVASQRRRNQTP